MPRDYDDTMLKIISMDMPTHRKNKDDEEKKKLKKPKDEDESIRSILQFLKKGLKQKPETPE